MRRKPLVLCLFACAALALTGAAVAGNGGLAPVTPESPNAERITNAWWFVVVFTGAIFVLVEGLLLLFIVRYRGRGRSREVEGPQIRGNTSLELAWTAGPVLILAAIAAFVLYKLPGIQDVPAARAGDRINVQVEGRQFYWQFRYPNGAVSIDRLRVPAGKVVALEITAPDWDVIHSWWVPALGGKFDAIPGQTIESWFRASRPGTYRGQCAELCGIEHTVMRAVVEVVPPEEYERWVAERANAQQSAEALGEEEWNGVCAKCHRLSGSKLVGPNLTPAALQDAASIRRLVQNGGVQMPPVGKGWSDAQLDALVAYTRRLAQGAQSGG